jgi:hypothetical protein
MLSKVKFLGLVLSGLLVLSGGRAMAGSGVQAQDQTSKPTYGKNVGKGKNGRYVNNGGNNYRRNGRYTNNGGNNNRRNGRNATNGRNNGTRY